MIPDIANPSTNAILASGFSSFFFSELMSFLASEEQRAIHNLISGGQDNHNYNLGRVQAIKYIQSDLGAWKSSCLEALTKT